MSESKHTPGPWIWRSKSGSLHRVGTPPYTYGDCVLEPTYDYDSGTDTAVNDADAHLIAAAPELLEAASLAMEGIEVLDNLIASVEKHGNYSVESTLGFLNQARCARLRLTDAIAKAVGTP